MPADRPGPLHVVVGAGGVGGAIAVGLALAGERVEVIARGAHLDTIRRSGLTRNSPAGTDTVRVRGHAHVADVGWEPGDVAIIATKQHQSDEILDELLGAAPPSISVACAQNGIDGERQALRRFGHTIGMLVNLPGTHLEPGVVDVHAHGPSGLLDVGPVDGAVDGTWERSVALAAALTRGGFLSEATGRVMARKRAKLLSNVGNSVQVICGNHDDVRGCRTLARAEAEARAVFAAAALDVDEADQRARSARVGRGEIEGRPREGGSSWQSVSRGTGSVESSYLNGEIVLLGRLHDVLTPANGLLMRLAMAQARSGRGVGTLTGAELDALLDAER